MFKVGLYGGTFDPFHNGHLEVIRQALEQVNVVLVVPSGESYKKAYREVSDKNHRYLMTVLGAKQLPDVIMSDYEIMKSGKSYTIDTIKYYYASDRELKLVVGNDCIKTIHEWKGFNEFFDYCSILPIPRSEISSTEIRKLVSEGKSVSKLVPYNVDRYIKINGLYKSL